MPRAATSPGSGRHPEPVHLDSWQQGGLTNPNGLGAVAAYAQHESRYSPSNITDHGRTRVRAFRPAPRAGSCRGALIGSPTCGRSNRGAADPWCAGQFPAAGEPAAHAGPAERQEPRGGQPPDADAWKFAGYNRPGGGNAARLATTQAYANSFAAAEEPCRRWQPRAEARWGRRRSAAASA